MGLRPRQGQSTEPYFGMGSTGIPQNARKRSIITKRYEKQVPGHHVQVDVKFLIFPQKDGSKVKRFQYTAIDDATRIRALKVYEKHTQKSAIDFIDTVVDKFSFRIQTVRTDNGHEFQSDNVRYLSHIW